MRTIAAATIFFTVALGEWLAPAMAQSMDVSVKASDAPGATTSSVNLYSQSKALVIGIDAYTARSWPKLSNAYNDAKAVAEALRTQGFDVILAKDLKAHELDATLRDFFIEQGAHPDARLLLWFAGHGHTVDGEGYIVPADAPGPETDAQFRRKAISLRRFSEYMREAKAKHVMAIFDSCFSGSVFNVARSAPPPAITNATLLSVRQFVSSGEAEQLVSDDGTFRRLFLDALAGLEPTADANRDGYITGTELGLFLHDKVTNLTQNRQTPRYGKLNAYGLDRGDFVFRIGTQITTAPVPASQPKSKPQQTIALTAPAQGRSPEPACQRAGPFCLEMQACRKNARALTCYVKIVFDNRGRNPQNYHSHLSIPRSDVWVEFRNGDRKPVSAIGNSSSAYGRRFSGLDSEEISIRIDGSLPAEVDSLIVEIAVLAGRPPTQNRYQVMFRDVPIQRN